MTNDLQRYIQIFAVSLAVLGCDYQPNQIRTTMKTGNIYQYIDPDSISFKRSADQRSGDFEFTLSQSYRCAVVFWSEDLNVEPFPESPKTYPCTDGETKQTFFFSSLKSGIPYSFRVMVWPERLTASNSASIVLRERQSLLDLSTDSIIVTTLITPRLAGETYAIQLAQSQDLFTIREHLGDLYHDTIGTCQSSSPNREFPYTLDTHTPEEGQLPFLGLNTVALDGYTRGAAKIHEFFPDRYSLALETTNSNQKIEWLINWRGKDFLFRTYPPVRFAEFTASQDSTAITIDNRSLLKAQPSYQFSRTPPQFSFKALYPGDFNYLHIHLRNPLIPDQSIYCIYDAGDDSFSIPEDIYRSLDRGSYELTAILESVKLHYESELPYPPWIMTFNDMIHFKFDKVM